MVVGPGSAYITGPLHTATRNSLVSKLNVQPQYTKEVS